MKSLIFKTKFHAHLFIYLVSRQEIWLRNGTSARATCQKNDLANWKLYWFKNNWKKYLHGYFGLVTPQNDFLLWNAKYIYFWTLDFHFHCMDKKCLFFFCSTEEISLTKHSMLAVCTHQCWPGPRTLVRCECLQDTAGWCWFYSWGLCVSVWGVD